MAQVMACWSSVPTLPTKNRKQFIHQTTRNIMNPTQYHPGQLLRVTTSFSVYNPNTGDLQWLRVDDIFLLLSVEKEDPQREECNDYETTMLTTRGELVVSEWWLEPFKEYETVNVEPVEVP